MTAKSGKEGAEIYETEVTREFGNEKNKLVIQPTGIIVLEFLMRHFQEVFNYDYTRLMEEDLDQISKGLKIGHEVCGECHHLLENKISGLKEDPREKKIEFAIDDSHFYIIGKHGPVIKKVDSKSKKGGKGGKSNVSFLPLKANINVDLSKLERGEYTLSDLTDTLENNDGKKKDGKSLGEWEGQPVYLKKGKFGLYLSYGSNTKSLSSMGNRPLESITWEQIKVLLEQGEDSNNNGSGLIRKITDSISIRKSKKGEDYLFFKTEKMKRPQFFDIKKFGQEFKEMDYQTCDLGFLYQWIKDKYSI